MKSNRGLVSALIIVIAFALAANSAFAAITVVAHKIVCDSESELPNWGLGGADITSTTAQNFINTHPNCHFESNWNFQWSFPQFPYPNDQAALGGSGWNTFGPTNANGMASVQISNLNGNQNIYARESFKQGYVWFGSVSNNVSAEFYCHNDVGTYDNIDFIGPLQDGQTYYCIGFNVQLPHCQNNAPNNLVGSGEECDDGNQNNYDLCGNDCQVKMLKIPLQSCTGSGEAFLYRGTDSFQSINTSFVVNHNNLIVFAWSTAGLTVKKNNVNAPLTQIAALGNYRAYLVNTTPGDLISVSSNALNGARQVQGYVAQDSSNPVYDLNSLQFVYDGDKSNTMFLTPGNYSYLFFDKYTQNSPPEGIDLRKLTPKITGPSGIVSQKTYVQPNPFMTQGAVVDHFIVNEEGIYVLNLSTEDSIYWPLFNCPIPVKRVPLKTCTGDGELLLYQGNNPFQSINTSFVVNKDQLLIFAWSTASLAVKVNNVATPFSTVGILGNYRIYSLNTTLGATVSVIGTAVMGAREVQGYISQNAATPIYDINDIQMIFDSQAENILYLTPGNYSYLFFDKYTENGPGQGPDFRKLTAAVNGPLGSVVNKTYTQPFPVGTQGAIADSFKINQEGLHKLSLNTEDSIYWPLFDCLPLVKKPVKTCTGNGDLYLYQGNPFQEIATSFIVGHDQLVIFSKPDGPLTFNVTVNGVKAKVTTVKNISSPFPVQVYSVNTTPGSLVTVNGQSPVGARSIQGYLSQDFANPVYNISNLQIIIDAAQADSMFLTPGNYSYVFFDKYTVSVPGGGIDLRKLTASVVGPAGLIVNQTYNQPSPVPVEGVVLGNFIASVTGNHTLGIDTEDSIYWPLTQCPQGPVCVNGIKEGDEQCDDGNQNNNDACKNDCTNNICGDGIVETGVEACDDGNQNNNDACRNDCTVPECGDGIKQGDEQCDDGNNLDNDGCNANCFPESCGDGVKQTSEACDDGNDDNNDACKNDCTNNICGDGIVETGIEACDDGNQNNDDSCRNDCTSPFCGDGIKDPDEQCDDGANNDLTNGCTNVCTFTFCGDGTLQQPNGLGVFEECDDGNVIDGDGCDQRCREEPSCGNGLIEVPEECDDGNQNNNDACNNDCTNNICGDGIVETGVEACDDGNQNNNDACRNDCTVPECGDGIKDANEQCDDGNENNLDSCRNDCTNPFCGDGFLDAGETCDDGNNVNDDGCDASCNEEHPCVKPLDVMLVIDKSGSMNQKDGVFTRLQNAKSASVNFLNFVNFSKDKAGLASFNHVASLNQGLTSSKPAVINAINALMASGQTNIGGGIKVGKNELAANGGPTKAMILLSDGAPNINSSGGICFGSFTLANSCAKYSIDEATAAKNVGIEIFTIGVGVDNLTQSLLKQIASSPANYFSAPNSTQLEAIYEEILPAICPEPSCGDGVIDQDEACDDGNNVDGDGCSAACGIEEPRCGDGNVDQGEQCDDGNENNNDGCRNDCTIPECGDEILDLGEECDDGNNLDNDGCNANCFPESCGDGVKQTSEACDDGNDDNNDACKNDCTNNICGDGIVETGVEACDDGNLDDNDGCNSACENEFCGDGVKQTDEFCDDGNNVNGDGCDSSCNEEHPCENPIDVMLVIDRSGSMNQQDGANTRLQNAKSSSVNFLNFVNFTKDKVGLASFNHIASLNQGLTSSKPAVTNAINALMVSGQTNIGGGVKTGRQELDSNGGANQYMILLSDGAPNTNSSGGICFGAFTLTNSCAKYSIDEATAAKNAGIEIFTIGLGVDSLTEQLLQQIATTPTNYFPAPTSSQLQQIYEDITGEICQ